MNTFRTSWHYHSETADDRIPRPAKSPPPEGLRPMTAVVEKGDFQISLDTVKYRPNNLVTLRTDVDGWARDIHGSYWDGAWRFVLPKADYPRGCQFKFLLNGTRWQTSDPLSIAKPVNTHLNEQHVSFPELPEEEQRFLHKYENLRVSDDLQQQNLVRSRFSEDMEWDIIVIGSGMGGGVLADALSDFPAKNLKVLVLDAGSFDYATHIYNLPVTGLDRLEGSNKVHHYDNVDDQQRFGEAVQMNLGGRSVFWSGLIPRMRDWELEHWPEPIRDYLKNGGYDRAEKLMRKHVAAGEFQENLIARMKGEFPGWTIVNTPRSSHQPDFGPEEAPEKHPPSFLFQSTGTFSSAELLLDSMNSGADRGKGLHVNLNHLVTDLVHDGSKVESVICQDLVGNCRREFRGKYVVLAAGSLESVKIALQSKLNDPHKKIGIGLTDHPSYYAPDGWAGGKTFYIEKGTTFDDPTRHARIFFYPDQPWEGHWFNVEIVLNGQYWRSRHADDDVLEAEHPRDARSMISFKFVFGSPIQEENSVQLPGRNERLIVRHAGNPTGEDARPAVLKLLKLLLEFFGVEPVDFENKGNCNFGNGGTVNHAGATLRMGCDGQPRVVDENLKFEGYDNLYVCDPSVYPYIPAANPSLTLVALALRLADHLAPKV